jgi:hypothetical protein
LEDTLIADLNIIFTHIILMGQFSESILFAPITDYPVNKTANRL